MARPGWLVQQRLISLTNTTPSAPSTVASQHSIDGAATPPRLRRGVVIMCAKTEASMRKRLLATFLVFACTGFAQQRGQQPAGLTEKQWQESREAQAHVTKAMAIAKPDLLTEAGNLCSARGPQRPAVLRQEAGLPPVPRQTLEPTKIFDNLYYIGFNDIGAWALTTSQGIIVIDSLNTPEEAEKILIPGMEKAGLDPKQVKYLIIGHGTSTI